MNLMEIPENMIRALLEFFRRVLNESFFRQQEEFFEIAASWAAPVVALLGLLMGMYGAIKADSFLFFLGGIGWVILVCVAYFIGKQFIDSTRKVISSNPSTISSASVLDTLGLIFIFILVLEVLAALYFTAQTSSLMPLLLGLGSAFATAYLISFMLNPELISTSVSSASTAGEDALAIMVVMYKASVRLATVVFGGSLVVGALLLLQSLYNAFTGDIALVIAGGIGSILGLGYVAVGLVYPFAIYISFVFFYLLVDICKAILTLHGRQSLAGGSPSAPAAPAPSAAPSGPGVSPEVLKRIVLVLVGLVVVSGAVVKGKEFYADYQAKAEAARIEEEARKAEEEARLAAEREQQAAAAAEKARLANFRAGVMQYVGRSSMELVRDQNVIGLFQAIFGTSHSAFEGYLGGGQVVVNLNGLLLAPGCREDLCGSERGLAVVDSTAGTAFVLVSSNGTLSYYGIEQAEVPVAVTQWVAANWQ